MGSLDSQIPIPHQLLEALHKFLEFLTQSLGNRLLDLFKNRLEIPDLLLGRALETIKDRNSLRPDVPDDGMEIVTLVASRHEKAVGQSVV